MIVNILLVLAGLALVVFGADWLVDGASAIARRVRISEFVIGLTIVGFGTSCPELVVSLTGAFAGNADISVGNVFGSNVFNTLLVLGLTAAIAPVAISESNRKRDIPITLLVTFMLVFCGMNLTLLKTGQADMLSRIEGVVFLVVFIIYIILCFKYDEGVDEAQEDRKLKNIWAMAGLTLVGLVALVGGGQLFVNSAVKLAHQLGVSDKFIAITLLAGGTSLPELATSVVAVAKHKEQLALGNILGSNVFNILLILGSAAVVTPLSFVNITMVDIAAVLASMLLVWMSTYTGKRDRIDRWEGILMLLAFCAYYTYLFINAGN